MWLWLRPPATSLPSASETKDSTPAPMTLYTNQVRFSPIFANFRQFSPILLTSFGDYFI